MILIDGSLGEGGGQVLRSSLTLSTITGKSIQIVNIRAGRRNPGLRPQHLQAVEAARAVSRAQLEGSKIGATTLSFSPEEITPGEYRFDIGTAGATSLVLQTIYLPLSMAAAPSTVSITGGTHVPWSPSFHYLDLHWRPFLRKIGLELALKLVRAGFYPQGGGQIRAVIQPRPAVLPLHALERGPLRRIQGVSAISNLSQQIAVRQRERAVQRLKGQAPLEIDVVRMPSRFKGTMLLLLAIFESSQCCFFSLGERGKPAERVADEAADALEAFLETDGAVDPYLADQLLLPLAFSGQESQLRTSMVTRHLITNAEIIHQFLPGRIQVMGQVGQAGSVHIRP